MKHDEVHGLFAHSFENFHDLEIKTVSLHGHKHFTAWEWEITCKAGITPEGQKVAKEDAEPKKLIGCSLMWWNDNDMVSSISLVLPQEGRGMAFLRTRSVKSYVLSL